MSLRKMVNHPIATTELRMPARPRLPLGSNTRLDMSATRRYEKNTHELRQRDMANRGESGVAAVRAPPSGRWGQVAGGAVVEHLLTLPARLAAPRPLGPPPSPAPRQQH